jgi:hypothetical protein
LLGASPRAVAKPQAGRAQAAKKRPNDVLNFLNFWDLLFPFLVSEFKLTWEVGTQEKTMESPRGDSGGTTTPVSGHPHLHHTGRRIRQFFMPDGRKIHVAHSPEELENHKRRKSSAAALEKMDEEEDFDVVLHGSSEHVSHPISSLGNVIYFEYTEDI